MGSFCLKMVKKMRATQQRISNNNTFICNLLIFVDVASAYQASLLVVEGSQLAGLVHANIASLAAACLDASCPLLAYTCTLDELNLKLYLTDGNHHPVTRDLVHVGAQVARAGAFLHGRGLLHRYYYTIHLR